jgi:hypothetical protein
VGAFPTKPGPNGARVFISKNNNGADDEERGRNLRAQTIRTFKDEALFGPCLARKSHQESVEQTVTPPISMYGVEIDAFREYDDDNGNSNDYCLPAVIQSAFHKLDIKFAVSFHSTNQRAREFVYLERVLEAFIFPPTMKLELKNQLMKSAIVEYSDSFSSGWDEQWEGDFQLRTKHKEREGDCNVPQSHVEDSENMGIWLSRQRASKNEGSLDKSREERFTNLGVV